MRIEEGIVKTIDNGRAVVEIKKASTEACARCGVCVAAGDTIRLIEVEAVPGLSLGKKVTLQIDSPSAYKSMSLLLFLPVVAFITGCMIGVKVDFILPETPNLRIGLFGLLSFAFSLIVASLYDRRIRSKGLQPPEILSIEGQTYYPTEEEIYAKGD
jgi:positive regulator of sigma E activity